MFGLCVIASIVDVVTGILKARITTGYDSTIMRKGLYGKATNLTVMAFAIAVEVGLEMLGTYYQQEMIAKWTGATAAATTAAEQYTRATVNGNMKDVRVHYYVDHKCAWQNLPLTLSGWHAADGSGNGNRRTIAIECIMSGAYNDTDRASEDNGARLAAELLRTYGLSIDNLYTHTHWLNVRDGYKGTVDYLNTLKRSKVKYCPLYILPHWQAFKAKVAGYLGDSTAAPAATPPETTKQTSDVPFFVRVADTSLNVRKGAGVEYPVSVVVYQGEVYTIVETAKAKDGGIWGRLKSGAGWINIGAGYCKRL